MYPSMPMASADSGLSESPTQCNEDRSYERFADPEPLPRFALDPVEVEVEVDVEADANANAAASFPDRTLDEDETGAVRFSLPSVVLSSDGPSLDGDGDPEPAVRRGFFRLAAGAAEAGTIGAAGTPGATAASRSLPETPSVPRNPFGARFQTPVLAGSQLFLETPASAMPASMPASPTSSRPSPAGLPAFALVTPRVPLSSSRKPRFPTSVLGDVTPLPLLPFTTSSPGDTPGETPRLLPRKPRGRTEETPRMSPRRRTGPMAEYEPMGASQRRRAAAGPTKPNTKPGSHMHGGDAPDPDSDSDDGVCQKRRRLARSKREEGARMLSTINMRIDEVEVPATTRKTRPVGAIATAIATATATSTSTTDVVADSGTALAGSVVSGSFEAIALPPSVDGPEPLPRRKTPSSSLPTAHRPALYRTSSLGATDAIPETSPAGRRSRMPRTPQAVASSQPAVEQADDAAEEADDVADGPDVMADTQSQEEAQKEQVATQTARPLPLMASTPPDPRLETPAPVRAPLETSGSSPPLLPPALSTRAWSRRAVAPSHALSARSASTSSSVSSLSSQTPSGPSREATPITVQGSDRSGGPKTATPDSSSPPRARRRPAVLGRRPRRTASPVRSGSTDELAPTPPVRAPLFAGMAFAISFQFQRPGEKAKAFAARKQQAEVLSQQVQDAGGRLLDKGFDELFQAVALAEESSVPSGASDASALCLLPSAATTGFTALLADGPSRKTKYMQALALGLPCLEARWATACLAAGAVVAWTPYLLCAGPSAFLDNAMRSRTLACNVLADARALPLADLVARRPRLLADVRVLLVLRRRGDDALRLPYVFLAQALGARLTRVDGVGAARAALRAQEDTGRPYDWVYDGGVAEGADGSGGADLFGHLAAGDGKKRKRARAAATAAAAAAAAAANNKDGDKRLPKRVALLSNERMVQSLIFGRLIRADEMAM